MSWLLLARIVGDVLFVNLSLIVAFYLRFWGNIPSKNWQAYISISPWIIFTAIVLFYIYGLYTSGRKSWDDIFYGLMCALFILFISSIAISYFFYQFAFPRLVFIISFPLLLLFMAIWRYYVWNWTLRILGPLRLLVAGPLSRATERAKRIGKIGQELYQVVGLLVSEREVKAGGNHNEFPLAGSYENLSLALKNNKANGLFICEGLPLEERTRLMSDAIVLGLSVIAVPEIYEIMLAKAQSGHINGIPVMQLKNGLTQSYKYWKRALDIVIVLVFGIIALPVVAIAALLIKFESPSSAVFYRQERVGMGNEHFSLVKLRTMIPDAEKSVGPVLSSPDDQRITRVGKVLRSLRIDELPQLWNVLKGEMSLVGPRPERPFFVERFIKEIPWYEYRHRVKVGVTGLAQVESDYNISPEDKLRFDYLYCQEANPLKDIYILFHTLKVIMSRKGSS